MKIRLSSAWITTGSFDNNQGNLLLEGVGEQRIMQKLPQGIIDQIEAFYINEYRERMVKAQDNEVDLRVPTNPQTYTDRKEPL